MMYSECILYFQVLGFFQREILSLGLVCIGVWPLITKPAGVRQVTSTSTYKKKTTKNLPARSFKGKALVVTNVSMMREN